MKLNAVIACFLLSACGEPAARTAAVTDPAAETEDAAVPARLDAELSGVEGAPGGAEANETLGDPDAGDVEAEVLPLNARCDDDAQCGDGAVCVAPEYESDDPNAGGHRCRRLVPSCFEHDCAEDEFCMDQRLFRTPIAYCEPRSPRDAECRLNGHDRDADPCPIGQVCASSGAKSFCRSQGRVEAAEGEACEWGGCGAGLYCDLDGGHVCRARQPPGARCEAGGTFCGDGRDCVTFSDACAYGLVCVFPDTDACLSWLDCRGPGQEGTCCQTDEGARCFEDRPADCRPPVGRCALGE